MSKVTKPHYASDETDAVTATRTWEESKANYQAKFENEAKAWYTASHDARQLQTTAADSSQVH